MNEAEKKFKEKGLITIGVTIPLLTWEEWNKDCELNFNGTRALKMKFDHEFKKHFQTVANLLMQDILELKEELFELKAALAQNEQTKKKGTF